MLKITVGVVGSGFGGSAFVFHLGKLLSGLNLLNVNVEMVIFESEPANFGGGIAYGQASNEHLTNIPAQRLSLDPDNPKDFLDWCNVKKLGITDQQPVPRRIFGAYIREKLLSVKNIRSVFGRVVDIQQDVFDGTYQVYIKDNGVSSTYSCNFVVLATGNTGVKSHPVLKQFSSPRIIQDLWNDKSKIASIPAHASVGIVGSGLTAYDACRSLMVQGHYGAIHMISRGGNRHFAYPPSNKPFEGPIQLHRPVYLDMPTIGLMEDLFKIEWQLMRREHSPERILENWSQYIPELIQKWGLETMLELYRKHQSLLTTNRVGVSHDAHQSVEVLLGRCNGEIIKGDIVAADVFSDSISLEIQKHYSTLYNRYDFVIVALGRTTKSPLLWKMANNGLIELHPLGGVQINENCQANNAGIYAIGALQQGHNTLSGKFAGPPANSVPGARQGIKNAAGEIAESIRKIDGLYNIHLLSTALRQISLH